LIERAPHDGSEVHNVLPDELTDAFRRLGLEEGDRVMMHASLQRVGTVEGGAAMVLHRLLKILGKDGILLMPTFTSVTRHSSTHDNYTAAGCWCGGKESRHLPFIAELQPDKDLGEIAYRLCSWPSSRRSQHPTYSFVAVGKHSDKLVREYSAVDPLQSLKDFIKENPTILTVGVGLESVSAIHVAEQRLTPSKFVKERALTITSKGQAWVDVTAMGCSGGFQKLEQHIGSENLKETQIGMATARLYSMRGLIQAAEKALQEDSMALACGRPECLSCIRSSIPQ
jgi:aminoglycoside 3-N-acetyltransferase